MFRFASNLLEQAQPLLTVEVQVGSPCVITADQAVITGIVTGEAFECLRRFMPLCLFVGINLAGRRRRRRSRWVLDGCVEFFNRRGKSSRSLCLTIIKVIAAGDVE